MVIQFPPSAKNADVTAALGAVEDTNAVAEYVQVCASPGEVSNVPRLGHQYRLQKGKHFPRAVVFCMGRMMKLSDFWRPPAKRWRHWRNGK